VMYIGPVRTVRGIRSWKPTAAFTLASNSLSPLTL
jgi:hypothetical protein